MIFIAAFIAGFLDSVVGGGGLVQIPALLVAFPEAPIATLFGTNKLAGCCGTALAAAQFTRRIAVPTRITVVMSVAALAFSILGARTVGYLDPKLMKPLIVVLLVLVLIYTIRRKDFGNTTAPRLSPGAEPVAAALAGAVLGFYDGFFGPGTGSFLIVALIGWFGFDFLLASAVAKVVNLSTNVGALAQFASEGSIFIALGAGMAGCNMAGSFLGSRMALSKGNGFVRGLFIGVVSLLILRLSWDLVAG